MAADAKSAPATEHKVRPTKPNEDAFKADLALAEKEHAAVQEKLVCGFDATNCFFLHRLLSIGLEYTLSVYSASPPWIPVGWLQPLRLRCTNPPLPSVLYTLNLFRHLFFFTIRYV
jgi:hypothetical protein